MQVGDIGGAGGAGSKWTAGWVMLTGSVCRVHRGLFRQAAAAQQRLMLCNTTRCRCVATHLLVSKLLWPVPARRRATSKRQETVRCRLHQISHALLVRHWIWRTYITQHAFRPSCFPTIASAACPLVGERPWSTHHASPTHQARPPHARGAHPRSTPPWSSC